MKAVVWEKYGDSKGLNFKEVDKPVAKIDEVLIKIYATTVSTGDIERVGDQVKNYKVGDLVVATNGFNFGCYAEYICLKPSSEMVTMALKPDFLSIYEAAALPVAGMEAYHYLELANIKKGDHILINGAEVTGVDAVEKFEMP